MKIRPNENYSVLGYGRLNKNKTYEACIATNQPDYKEKGLIFVEANDDLRIELLLTSDEYGVIEDDLDIPEFLQRDYDPVKWLESYIPPKNEPWWMPDLQKYKAEKEAREARSAEIREHKQQVKARKLTKQKHEHYVLDALSHGANTFGKMRKALHLEDNQIKSALNRLRTANKITITGRVYKAQL